MPLFNKLGDKLSLIKSKEFLLEKELQQLIEDNLEEIFSCRFIATEFSTGVNHSGRIDTIALSEDNNPVIIEYKKVESSKLLNQSLFYLHWLKDHSGDFQIAVNNALGNDVEVDWSSIRVICIAPAYKKYDLHAAEMMNAPIELWKYKNYENGMLSLEEVFSAREARQPKVKQNEVKKDENNETALDYNLLNHVEKLGTGELKVLFENVKEYVLSKDDMVDEVPTKHYLAYKLSKSFICLKFQKKKIVVTLRFNKENMLEFSEYGRDMTDIGHHGGLPFEVQISKKEDLEKLKEMIDVAFNNIGG